MNRPPGALPLDTDRDGIDDRFELQRPAVFDPRNAADATLHFDGDGKSKTVPSPSAGVAKQFSCKSATISTSHARPALTTASFPASLRR